MNEIKLAPRVEKISDDEVYLLSPENIRTERICGKIREGIPGEYPCVTKAGHGTTHSGVGLCSEHDTTSLAKAKPRNPYELLIDKDNKRSILDYIAITNSSKNEHHTSIDTEIELMEALVASQLSRVQENTLTPGQADDIAKLIDKLSKLKKIKIDASKKEKLDSEVVAKFLGGIMGVIKMHTKGEQTKRIMLDIITNIVVPMMNREEITKTDPIMLRGMIEAESR